MFGMFRKAAENDVTTGYKKKPYQCVVSHPSSLIRLDSHNIFSSFNKNQPRYENAHIVIELLILKEINFTTQTLLSLAALFC